MRIPSGKVDQNIYFVAVDSVDLKTRKTGLSSFTVYRSRNGGAATVYTTPTIVELSAANMPGVYCLLIDEDTTIASTSDAEEQVLHITQASMAPVTRVIELFRRDTTSGRTLSVDANSRVDLGSILGTAVATPATAGVLDVNIKNIANAAVNTANAQIGVNVVNAAGTAWNSGAIGAATLAADTIGASELAADAVTEIAAGVWANAVRTLSSNANLNDLSAAGVRAAIGMASANLDTQLATFATAANLTTVGNNVSAIKAKTDNLPSDPLSASAVAGLVMDETDGIEVGYTNRQTLRLMAGALLGKASGFGTTLVTFRDMNDTKDRITANVDDFGNRLNVTRDGS